MADVSSLILKGIKSPFPKDIKPMLATLVDEPVNGEEWEYEIKWDGYRALAYIDKKGIEIRSRNNKSFNEKFYPVYNALKKWKTNAVVDGEILVVNEHGVPKFNELQQWRSEADGQLVYYIFDLLWLNGRDIMHLPLNERRAILKSIVPDKGAIQFSADFKSTGTEIFEMADKMGLEGIMAKKTNSIYLPGSRSRDWLKIKTDKFQEAVIGGYTLNENSGKLFSALLLGLFEKGKFEYLGTVGTGWSDKLQKEILDKLTPYKIDVCPFSTVPDFNKPSRFRPDPPKAAVTWVKPVLVCEISYREITEDRKLRHPSFKGLREDKKALEIVLEQALPVESVTKKISIGNKPVLQAPEKKERQTLLNPSEESQTRKVQGHELKFSNINKIYWPKKVHRAVTKGDMINYYYQAAPFILPHIKNRPLTLNRYPNGINGEAFYQKDVKGKIPGWIKTSPYRSETEDQDKEFLLCNDEATLLYVASLGCIEINPWNSSIKKPANPDWCIIDLDPDKNTFNQVIEAALVTKKILDAIDITSYCKTSGSTGLHIYIPLAAKYTYEDSKEFGRSLATLIHSEIPGFTSIERQIGNRKGKMYIDFLQNRPQATVASVYSLRPKPGATVSMPLHWEEVKKGLAISDFNIFNAIERMRAEGDIFEGVLGKGMNIKKGKKVIDDVLKSNQ